MVSVIVGGFSYHLNTQSKNPAYADNQSSASEKTTSSSTDSAVASAEIDGQGYYTLPDSKVSIKTPSGWAVKGQSNAFAAVIENPSDSNQSVYIRTIILSSSFTPENEWNNCPSADACGPAPGQSKISDESFTTSGLDAYRVKMTSSTGNYNAVIVEGKNNLGNDTRLFTEFITYGDDSASIAKLNELVESIKLQ